MAAVDTDDKLFDAAEISIYEGVRTAHLQQRGKPIVQLNWTHHAVGL